MHPTSQQLVRIDDLEASLSELSARYASAEPYPHIVLDDVLQPEVIQRAYDEFTEIPDDAWTNYLHLNERKYAAKDITTWGPTLQAVAAEFASDRFVAFLEELTGFQGLHADDVMDGGGLHRSVAGGFLNVHADFTAHHSKLTWRRRVNLLLYLNPEWDPAWGGQLQLWSKDMQQAVTRVAPEGNRLLIFTTDEHSYHGHPEPLRVPEGLARQSMALYYFTEEAHPLTRSTDYRARPGDGIRGAYIYLDKKVLAAYDVVKRRLHLSDGAVSRTLGAVSRLGRRSPRP
jgi:Rps23 Pro-64 3,4-dihydroxylase Tpa1-like proline 4-hydroxylase